MRARTSFTCLLLGLFVPSVLVATSPYKVTFVLDMREEIAARRFDPAKASVGVRGSMPPLSWGSTMPAVDPEGDGLYEVTVTFPAAPFGGQPVPYKFKIEAEADRGGGWEDGNNRRVALDTPAQTVRRRFNEPPPPIAPTLTGDLRRHDGGSSFGGLVTVHIGLKHPEVFGSLLAVTPSVWWDEHVLLKTVAALPGKTAQRIWKLGADLAYLEQEDGEHDEIAWASRVEPLLRFLWERAEPPRTKQPVYSESRNGGAAHGDS